MTSYRDKINQQEELEMHVNDFLDLIDEQIEDLDLKEPMERKKLSDLCHRVGLNLHRRCYFKNRDTTPNLKLWKWWAEQHKIVTDDFDYWWDHIFM